MPLFTEIEEPEFAAAEARHRWFPNVMLADYGELSAAPEDTEVPDALNWLLMVPPERRYDFEDAECSLVYVSPDGSYTATLWDATGEDDDPWAVFWVDDFGPRLLTEYSLFDEEASEEEQESVLRRAAEEIPEKAERGEFTRTGEPIEIPDWLMDEEPDETDEEQ
jgi:hypothetical protein